MNKEICKTDKGITLVALIVTIIILVIIAAVSIKTIYDMNFVGVAIKGTEGYMETQMNEMDTMESLAKYIEEAVRDITEGNGSEGEEPKDSEQPETPEQPEIPEEPGNPVITTVWTNGTQDKTSVTNGEVTLEVGQAVTGYTANGVGDGNWYVLGVENGKLLITTNSNQGTITLSGQDGYVNGVRTLNTAAATYRDSNMADSARSINVEDINRVTGYDPDVAKYGGAQIHRWKNEVTYTKNSDTYIYYKESNYAATSTKSDYTKFTYWTGGTWSTLANGASATIMSNYYLYYPQTLKEASSSETQINGSTDAYNLLFANTSSASTHYWLGSQLVTTNPGECRFGMFRVREGVVDGTALYYSSDFSVTSFYGLRPVVTLKSNIKVSSDGTLSM